MKSYPSIPQSKGTKFREIPNAHIFDKLDGSNLRAEWTKKGWGKFGTRNRLFDESDWQFGRAIPQFMTTLSQPLEKIFSDERYERCIVFFEHWGPSSFAGNHHHPGEFPQKPLDDYDQMRNDLIDVAPYKRGILPPDEFVRLFGHLPSARYLGRVNWTRGFVESVYNGEIEGVTFEGVVGKAGVKHDLVMAKAKTKTWIDKVKTKYSAEDAEKIVNS